MYTIYSLYTQRIIGFGEIKVLLGIQNNRQLNFELSECRPYWKGGGDKKQLQN